MQAIVVNSGIANSCTGKQGEKDAFKMQQLAANKLQIQQEYVGVAYWKGDANVYSKEWLFQTS